MIFENLFSSYLLSTTLNLDAEEIEKYCYECRSEDEGVHKSNVGGWQSNTITKQNDEISKLVNEIESYCNDLKIDLGFKKNLTAKINNIWININSDGTFNIPHIHPDSIFSGVYYVKKSQDDGNIVFKTPAINQQYHYEKNLIENFTPYTSQVYKIPGDTNKLLLFPSWLEHYVEPNLSKVDRISIAFNVTLLEDKT